MGQRARDALASGWTHSGRTMCEGKMNVFCSYGLKAVTWKTRARIFAAANGGFLSLTILF